ncbi:hypothetical protein CBOM_02379 [Ceraceosorus bombacis]|uniref:Uncharacterized protein n=1 Tax=Ceraceosorus bombacis TaxID=401625 RepID=A0A0P1BEC5_9BASI|nr:hypothetical protein CBOM_02379 [Ceraceosorus bombacis]
MSSLPFAGARSGAAAVSQVSPTGQAAVPTSMTAGAIVDDIPYDQLAQLSKTMGSVIRSLLELQNQIHNSYAPDDWSKLLTQHMELISATHTLTSLVSSPTPTHDAQMAFLNTFLAAEADSKNLYAGNVSDGGSQAITGSGVDALGLPVGGSLSKGQQRHATAEGTPRVDYSNEARRERGNLLERIAVHPSGVLDAEQKARLTELLRARVDFGLENAWEKGWQEWCVQHPVSQEPAASAPAQPNATFASATAAEEQTRKEAKRRLRIARSQQRKHDDASIACLRAYWHLKQQPDENGEKYDWKMRISDEELREMEAEDAEQEGVQDGEEVEMNVD